MSEARGWRLAFTRPFWRAFGELMLDLSYARGWYWEGVRRENGEADRPKPVEKPVKKPE